MQNVSQETNSDNQKHEKSASIHRDIGKTSSTPQSSNSSPTKSETETFSELQPRFMTDSSESEEDSVSEVNWIQSFGIISFFLITLLNSLSPFALCTTLLFYAKNYPMSYHIFLLNCLFTPTFLDSLRLFRFSHIRPLSVRVFVYNQ